MTFVFDLSINEINCHYIGHSEFHIQGTFYEEIEKEFLDLSMYNYYIIKISPYFNLIYF
jgi:hypothetical protein